MRTIAVTGASGYVGGRLVEHLRLRGFGVRPLTREHVAWLGEGQAVVDPLGPEEALQEALAGADAVVHLAGPNEIAATTDPDGTTCVTIAAARRVAAAALAADVPRVVVASTIHVYGDALKPGAAVDEQTAPAPRHPYGIGRLAAEHAAAATGADLAVLRLANGVGAPAAASVDRWTLVTNDLCRQAVVDGRLCLRTSGVQWRDFVALTDVCTVLTAACDPRRLPSGVYNVATGSSSTVRALAGTVAEQAERLLGHRPALDAPEPQGDPPKPYRLVVDRLGKFMPLPATSMEDAVTETLQFCIDHREEL